MSKSLDGLQSDFKTKVEKLLSQCSDLGYKMVPYCTIRDVFEQACLWRQSRSTTEIRSAILMLEKKGAPWLAWVLGSVGPQYGRWATDALPGTSWHQYGEAVDCYLFEKGKAVWNPYRKGYEVYAKEAQTLDLICGRYWEKWDPVHVQHFNRKVLDTTDWETIDQIMKGKYGGIKPQKILPSL